MSYFMTVAGDISSLKLEGTDGFRLVPVAEAQKYIQNLAAEIQEADGSPLFLVDDGESGTSHNIVCQAQDSLNENGTLDGTIMLKLMEQFAQNGNPLRIWWATNDPRAHDSAEIFSSLNEVIARLKEQAGHGNLKIRFIPSNKPAPGARP